MTRKRLAPVLLISGLLVVAWAVQGLANFPVMQGPMGPPMPMPMPVNVGPKKCAPQLPCQPAMCGPVDCAPTKCQPLVCPPPTCAPPACPPAVCGPPPCPPPMCGPSQCGGGGPLEGLKNGLATAIGIVGLPFRLLDNFLCAKPKCGPPPCPPMVCAPPACGPMAYAPGPGMPMMPRGPRPLKNR
jgi:hypothetical protein